MYLTIAVLLFALAGVALFDTRKRGKHRVRPSWLRLTVGLALLTGGSIATGLGLSYPNAFMPDAYSNCTYGIGAGAHVCTGKRLDALAPPSN